MVVNTSPTLTVSINKKLKDEIKRKILDYDEIYLRDYVEAGLIMVKDKTDIQIRNIIKRYSTGGGK